jgi:Raf kinase inhibitor-like YbhB/YbcL family protein
MGIGHEIGQTFGHALKDVRARTERIVSRRLAGTMPPRVSVTSPEFAHGESLPVASTVDGVGRAPTVAWSGLPPGTKSVALVCEDPDAPFREPFVHWLAYGIAPGTLSVGPDAASGDAIHFGKNTKHGIGYTPSAPPPGHGVHHYHFQVFALDTPVDLDPGADRATLVARMKDHVVGWGELVGTYERN